MERLIELVLALVSQPAFKAVDRFVCFSESDQELLLVGLDSDHELSLPVLVLLQIEPVCLRDDVSWNGHPGAWSLVFFFEVREAQILDRVIRKFLVVSNVGVSWTEIYIFHFEIDFKVARCLMKAAIDELRSV